LQTPSNFQPLLSPLESGFKACRNFIFRGDELLVSNVDLALPEDTVSTFFGLVSGDFHPLGLLEEHYCRTAFVAGEVQAPEGYRFSKMRPLFGAMSLETLALAGRAFQISDWARTHRFCGACSAPMKLLKGERCYRCTACKFMAYPRISPAMMVLVKKGDSILLARHIAAIGNRFSALAGFVEAGESVEETVHREVYEEVGLRVTNLKYFGTQPWSFPHSLMIAFTAEYLSGEINVDKTEIAEARWIGPDDEVPEFMRGVSISGELIAANLPRKNLTAT
jgi:NAD+ diphosphatase